MARVKRQTLIFRIARVHSSLERSVKQFFKNLASLDVLRPNSKGVLMAFSDFESLSDQSVAEMQQ